MAFSLFIFIRVPVRPLPLNALIICTQGGQPNGELKKKTKSQQLGRPKRFNLRKYTGNGKKSKRNAFCLFFLLSTNVSCVR